MAEIEEVHKSPSANGDCPGDLNFMASSSTSSLLRNGKVFIDRDLDGNTNQSQGIDVESKSHTIINARRLNQQAPNCDSNGFELQYQPLRNETVNFLDHDQVVSAYYAECETIVSNATGARAFAFDHNVRSASGKMSQQQITGGQHVQGPAHIVHGDINVWRNIAAEPVATHPLALCDGQTVMPEDLVVFEIHYPDRIGENYFSKASDRHQFYYYPEMTRGEVLLIKQWDSAGRLALSAGSESDAPAMPCTFSFHSAFKQPGQDENVPDRWSIEVRCMVIYPR